MASNPNLASPNTGTRTQSPRAAHDDASRNPSTSTGQGSTEEAIRQRAYALWETAGRPDGDGAQFWYLAEQELNPRH